MILHDPAPVIGEECGPCGFASVNALVPWGAHLALCLQRDLHMLLRQWHEWATPIAFTHSKPSTDSYTHITRRFSGGELSLISNSRKILFSLGRGK